MSDEFETLPGIGPTLARRLREQLQARSLTALARAAHDGRLDGVPGIGPTRARALRTALASLRCGDPTEPHLTTSQVLALDAEFRAAAAAGALPRAPAPGGGWREVLHRRVAGRSFVVHWSTSARARRLSRDHDWVVVREEHKDGERATVVSEGGARSVRR